MTTKKQKKEGGMRIPKAVKREAQMASFLHQMGFLGMTETGWTRMKQLSNDVWISHSDLMEIKAWMARHYYTSRPNYLEWKESSRDKEKKDYLLGTKTRLRGMIAWSGWGGEAMYNIVQSMSEE